MSKNVSTTMRAALAKMRGGHGEIHWQCSYVLGVGLQTMYALRARGLVESRDEAATILTPRGEIGWRLTEAGKAVRDE